MAVSSISATIFPSLSLSTSSSRHSTPKFTSLLVPSVCTLKLKTAKALHSPSKVFAAPEALDSLETLDPSIEAFDESESSTYEGAELGTTSTVSLAIGSDAEKMVSKQKIRIKLRSYFVPLIEDASKKILDAARSSNAKTMGPVPLPTKKRVYCLLNSSFVHKDSRFVFEIRTHQRLIDILHPTAQTIDALMLLDLPVAVDVEVKL